MDLRPYILFGDKVTIVPGGLTRVAADETMGALSMQSGASSKDAWVLSEAPVDNFSLLSNQGRTIEIKRIEAVEMAALADCAGKPDALATKVFAAALLRIGPGGEPREPSHVPHHREPGSTMPAQTTPDEAPSPSSAPIQYKPVETRPPQEAPIPSAARLWQGLLRYPPPASPFLRW